MQDARKLIDFEIDKQHHAENLLITYENKTDFVNIHSQYGDFTPVPLVVH